jgi:two-component sensor histidine kinase
MHVVTTNTGEWVEGSSTEIRVEFDDEARAETEKWSGSGENMLEKCFWRLVHERWDEVHGPSVEFRLNRRDVLGLIERLRVANAKTDH